MLHETCYDYDAPVELAHHLGMLRPRHTPLQQVLEWQLSVTPQPDIAPAAPGVPDDPDGLLRAGDERVLVTPGVQQSLDPWGNHRVGFSHSRVHDRLVVSSSFVADIAPLPRLQPEASPAWEVVTERLYYRPGAGFEPAVEFTLGSLYAPREASLARFGAEVFRPGVPLLAGALAMMHLIHRRFEYRPLATSVNTRAPAALAQRAADFVVTSGRLARLPQAIGIARRTRRVIRQNLTWAAAYNLLALPLAATGHVTPWMAALGMALSSLLVTLNALRLAKVRDA